MAHHLTKNNDLGEAALFTSLNELQRKNIKINDVRTSVTLEPKVWTILQDLAAENNTNVHALCTFIYDRKSKGSSLSSAIRVFLISYLDIIRAKNKAR